MGGDTEREALANARKTAKDFLEIMLQGGLPIPLSILSWDEAKKLPGTRNKEGYYTEDITINLPPI